MARFLERLRRFAGNLIGASAERRGANGRSACAMETLETRQLLSLTIDLRLPGGAKTAEVSSVGQTLTMQVWAVVQGQDASGSNDGLWDAVGSFLSSGVGATALGGDLSATLQAPFNGVVAQAGTVQDLNGDGHLDVGSNNNSISTDFFIAYAASPQFGGTVSGATNSFLIGTLTYTVTSLGAGSTRINFRPRTESAAQWFEDGNEVNPSASTPYVAGTPITISDFPTPQIALNTKGQLGITGTSGNDSIVVSVKSGNLTAKVGVMSRVFAVSKVKSINILGRGGNDTITVGKGVVACKIDGGDGNDTIRAGNGNDNILGGAGNDTIYCRNGVRDTVDGGTGTNSAQVDKIDVLKHIQKILK